jgi:endo-1,4-beta-xylanase
MMDGCRSGRRDRRISRRELVRTVGGAAALVFLTASPAEALAAVPPGPSASVSAHPRTVANVRQVSGETLGVVTEVSPFRPLELRNPIPRPYGYILLGSGLVASGDVQIDATFTHRWSDQTPEISWAGIRFTNGFVQGGPNQNNLHLSHTRRGRLNLEHRHGDQSDNTDLGPATEDFDSVTLRIPADGQSVTVTSSHGTRTVPLNVPLYGSGRSMLVIASLGPHATCQVAHLSIAGADAAAATAGVSGDPLRVVAAARGMSVGTLANPFRPSLDPRYESLLRTQFNHMLVPLHPSEFRPDRRTFNFSESDAAVNFAGQNGLDVMGQHLVYYFPGSPEHLPGWLRDGSFARDEMLAIMREQIVAILEHYRETVPRWVVVNEAANVADFRQGDFWHQRIGPEYVEEAFRTARQAAPEAVLFYNDNYPIPGSQTDRIFNLVADLKAKGLIDGVGIQMHVKIGGAVGPPWQADAPTRDALLAEMRRLGDLGLAVEITELDVNVFGGPLSMEEKLQRQGQAYADIVRAALESGVCRRITTFGFVDPFSWLFSTPELQSVSEAPLLFDEAYQAKPAFFALRDALA